MAANRSNHSDNSFGEQNMNPYTSDDQPSADTPANMWSAVDGAQREQPEPYRPTPHVPGPQAGPAAVPRNDNKGLTIAVIVSALVAVTLSVGTITYFHLSDSRGANSADSNLSQSVQPTSVEDSFTSSTAEQKRRAEGFQPPSNWHRRSDSRNSGDLNLVYTGDVGDNTTICQSITNVCNSSVEQYQPVKELNSTVIASNPTAGRAYTMTYCDNGEVVTYTGSTDITVHIV